MIYVPQYEVIKNSEGVPSLYKVREVRCNYEYLTQPELIYEFAKSDDIHADKFIEEQVWVLCFNSLIAPIALFEVSHGDVAVAPIYLRSVMHRVLLSGCCSFILIHNHPCGNVTPSKADLEMIKDLKAASLVIGIDFNDFMIVSEKTYYSAYEADRMKEKKAS